LIGAWKKLPEKKEEWISKQYDILEKELGEKGVELEKVKKKLKEFTVEVPSWIFGEFGGGRFGGHVPPGAARTIFEKLDDAAIVHQITGATPNVSIHVGWDDPDENPFDEIQSGSFRRLNFHAHKLNLKIGSVSPTYFLEGTHFGSLSALDPTTRQRFIDHGLVAAEIAENFGTGFITLWFPDGSLYPGQVNMHVAIRNLKNSLKEIYEQAPNAVKMLIEYKLFEPGTYHTVISDLAGAMDVARSLGDRAGVLIDLGHHPFGVNVEYIATRVMESGMLAGVHFNSRYAADDDHAVEPNMQLFRIFHEMVAGGVIGNENPDENWLRVLDQCSGLENRIHAVLHSVDSLMISHAKALIVDEDSLARHQKKNEIILANRTLLDAFLTDVRPILYQVRLEKGLPLDFIDAYDKSGYQEKIEKER